MSSKLPANKPGLSVGKDEVGAALGSIETQLQNLQAEQNAQTAITVSAPEPCTTGGIDGGGFIAAYDKSKKDSCGITGCVNCPNGTVRIKAVFITHADAQSAGTFGNRIPLDYELSQDDTAAGTVAPFWRGFLYGTQYDLAELVSISDQGLRIANPADGNTKFATYAPLCTFTTPQQGGAPSGPDSSLIVANALDPSTKAFDAYTTFRILAPLDLSGHAQSWAASKVDTITAIVVDGNGKRHHIIGTLDSTEAAQTISGLSGAFAAYNGGGYVDRTIRREIPSASMTWVGNVAWTLGTGITAVGNVPYLAGNLGENIQSLVGVNLALVQTDPNDGTGAALYLEFTQPTPGVALKHATVFMSKTGCVPANFISPPLVHKHSLKEDEFNVPGQAYTVVNGKAITLHQNLKLKPNTSYCFQLVLTAIGDVQYLVAGNPPMFAFTTNASGFIVNDTAAPSGLATPIFNFTSKAGMIVRGLDVANQFNSPADPAKYLVIYDGVTTYLDLPTFYSTGVIQTTFVEANARLGIGDINKDHIPVPLKKMRALFGASANVFAYFYAANRAFGLSTKSGNGSLNLANPYDNTNANGAVDGVDVSVTMVTPTNLLYNGDFLYDSNNPPIGQLGGVNPWSNGVAAFGGTPITISSSGVVWDQPNHALNVTAALLRLSQTGRRRYIPGDFLVISFLAKSTGSPTITATAHLYDEVTTADDAIPNPASVTFVPTGIFNCYGIPFQYNPNAGGGNRHSFALDFTGQFGNTLTVARLMLVRGKSPSAYSPHPKDVGPDGTENPSSGVATAAGAAGGFDSSNPTHGVPGGWGPPGSGVQINITL